MQPRAEQKVSFYKSNNFMRSWAKQEGRTCQEDIALSMKLPPPPVRGGEAAALAKKVHAPERKQSSEDPYVNTILGAMRVAEAASNTVGSFQNWLRSPPAAPAGPLAKPLQTVPRFDIQEIPKAMRTLSMPVSAVLMKRWFTGQLNYSPTKQDEADELNQDGLPYPPSMIDTNTIKLEWVLKFARAKEGLDRLLGNLDTSNAHDAIAKILRRYKNQTTVWPALVCKGDIARLHKEFQFQFEGVEGNWSQKLMQQLTQELHNEGVPDDLTGALGSFYIYAAIGYAVIDPRLKSGEVTDISVYVKDNYTFTDKSDANGNTRTSQYLGHWNKSHVALVPANAIAQAANIDWLDYPIFQGNVYDKEAVLYPVKNSSFRLWQKTHSRGGDFIIYSDRVNIKLKKSIRVNF